MRCHDHNDLNNYQPVSSLCFIANILERLVLFHVSSYINSHNFTILFNQHIVLVTALKQLFWLTFKWSVTFINKCNMFILALLDFSSAFVSSDHSFLQQRLHIVFGLTDFVLQCISCCLNDRTHYASLSNHCSALTPVHSGVTRGSILYPIIITMYIRPLYAIT